MFLGTRRFRLGFWVGEYYWIRNVELCYVRTTRECRNLIMIRQDQKVSCHFLSRQTFLELLWLEISSCHNSAGLEIFGYQKSFSWKLSRNHNSLGSKIESYGWRGFIWLHKMSHVLKNDSSGWDGEGFRYPLVGAHRDCFEMVGNIHAFVFVSFAVVRVHVCWGLLELLEAYISKVSWYIWGFDARLQHLEISTI